MLIQDNTGQLETFNAEVPTAFFNTLISYAVVAGISNNARKRFDLVRTRQLLGYEPQDDGFRVRGIDEGDG